MDKLKLSKHILDMKFMKKTKEKVEHLEYQKEGEEYFENELTNRMKKESGNFILEPSFIFCENLIEGRLSFQGTNPELERLLEIERAQQNPDNAENINEKDVSDTAMANWKAGNNHKMFYSQNAKNDSKNISCGEPELKKRKFLKPSD